MSGLGAITNGVGFAGGPDFDPCALPAAPKYLWKGLNGLQTVGSAYSIFDNLVGGNPVRAGIDAFKMTSSYLWMMKACFAVGTPIVMDEEGNFKLIEDIVPGDFVLSRDENDPHSPLDRKRVLEKFVRVAEIWHLTVNGQLIKTTGEHPFFTERTWSFIPTTELRVGDRFLSDDGQWVTCEEVYNTGKYETVYNFRVADFATYFVGEKSWGWSIWAHNMCSPAERTNRLQQLKAALADENLHPQLKRAIVAEYNQLVGIEIPFFPLNPPDHFPQVPKTPNLPTSLIRFVGNTWKEFKRIVGSWFSDEVRKNYNPKHKEKDFITEAREWYEAMRDPNGPTPVIGTVDDTQAFRLAGNTSGKIATRHNNNEQVLWANAWTLGTNDAWILGAIEAGKRVRIVSNIHEPAYREGVINIHRKPHWGESVLNRELRLLNQHGYRFVQDP